MAFKKRATLSMMEHLQTKYDVPDVVTSPEYIRSRVIALVDRELFFIAQSADNVETPPEKIEEVSEEKTEPQPEPEPEPKVESKSEPKRDHIPPPPGEQVESSEDDD